LTEEAWWSVAARHEVRLPVAVLLVVGRGFATGRISVGPGLLSLLVGLAQGHSSLEPWRPPGTRGNAFLRAPLQLKIAAMALDEDKQTAKQRGRAGSHTFMTASSTEGTIYAERTTGSRRQIQPPLPANTTTPPYTITTTIETNIPRIDEDIQNNYNNDQLRRTRTLGFKMCFLINLYTELVRGLPHCSTNFRKSANARYFDVMPKTQASFRDIV
jgi:hypothetical protein